MYTVKFNEIKDQFKRMAVLWQQNTYGIANHYTKDASGKYVAVLWPTKEDPNILVNAISVLDPDVTICETDEEYGANMGHFQYRPTQMYGFKIGNEGMVDFVDGEKTATFYFR